MTSRKLLFSASLLLCLSLTSSSAHAQYRASIQGVISDPQGAVVPDATVTLTNKETGRALTTTSNGGGIYSFNALPPSRYSMTAEKTGFKKKVLDDVGVIAEQSNAVNIQLDLGQSSETVTVTGDATPLIDTETANVSGTVTAQQIQTMPSMGRDVFQLLQLAPGAFGDGAQAGGGGTQNLPGTTIGGTSATDGIFKTENGGQISANGARTGENNYQIDGVGMTSVSWGGTAVITPNEESVKEVKVVTNNYDAENGRYRGAQIQIISQNGTNQYHGSAFIKADRPGLNAFQRYNGPGNALTRNTSRFNDFGGSVGGPIIHNRLFGFFSYETIRNQSPTTPVGNWFETSQFDSSAPAGSNAAKILTFPGAGAAPGTILEDPGSNQHDCAFIGLIEGTNCHFIAGQGLDIGRPLTSALGTPDPSFVANTNPGLGGDGTGSSSNLDGIPDILFISNSAPNKVTEAQYNGRIDFNLTSKDLLAFSLYRVPASSDSFNGAFRDMNAFHHTVTNEAETILWNRTFSPSLLNEARANAAGWRWKDLQNNPNGPWGLPVTNIGVLNGPSNNVGTGTVQNWGIGAPGLFDQWTYGVKDTLTKVLHSHTLKMGGEVTRLLFVDTSPWSARPTYYFNNMWDFLNDAASGENATFNPITGVPADFRKDTRSNLYGFFVQDDYKLKPNFTLNLGLRWEYFGPISEKRGNLSTVVLGPGTTALSGMSVRLGGNLYTADKKNFGPQLGFAWSPMKYNNRLVVRGGFGIGYNGLDEAISLNGRSNPPFVSAAGNLTGNQIVYANSFPADVHSFYGYAPNPATIENFDPTTHLPVPGPNFALIDVTGFPAHWPTTYAYRYSLQTEYDLGHDWVWSLGYQGSIARHLTRQYNLNVVLGAQGLAFNPVVQHVDWFANDGTSNFNALLAELRHRFGRSFQISTQYRWSKSMDTGSNNYANGNYQYNLATDYGPSDYDTTHAFKIFGVWSPTIFTGSRGWLEKIVGGWSLSGILNAHSGFPFNPVFNTGCDALYQGSAGGGGQCSLRPAAYLGGAGSSYSNDTFKQPGGNFPKGGPAYFVAPAVTNGPSFSDIVNGLASPGPIPTPPGIERNQFRGPRYFDIDATLSKSFGLPTMKVLGEGARFEFRANAFNLFNQVNLRPDIQANILDPHFGQPQAALGGRTVELQARFSF
jgi:carboxypeptidase family protein/TonB-dependent receptor-like protein